MFAAEFAVTRSVTQRSKFMRGKTGDFVEWRNGWAYFQARIPADLRHAFGGKTRLSKALATTHPGTARDRARDHISAFKKQVAAFRAMPPAARSFGTLQALSDKAREPVAVLAALARGEIVDPAPLALLPALVEDMRANEAAMATAADIDYPSLVMARVGRQLLDAPVRLPPESNNLDETSKAALLKGLELQRQEDVAVLDAELRMYGTKLRHAGVPLPLAMGDTNSTVPRISEAIDIFLAEGNTKSASRAFPIGTARKHRQRLALFAEHCDNCHFDQLTTQTIESFIAALRMCADASALPGKRIKRTLSELIALRAANPTLPAKGSASVEKFYAAVSSFTNFGWRRRWLEHKLCPDVRDKPKHKPAKHEEILAYTAEQSRAIFESVAEQSKRFDFSKTRNLDLRWHLLLQMFTGCSPEESAQLVCRDIECVTVGASPIWTIDINAASGGKVKNENRARRIPIHPKLIKLGFIDFARKRGTNGARIFATFKPDSGGYLNAYVGRRIGRLVRSLGITDDRHNPQYSFRHRFHDAMDNAGVPLGIQEKLVGHQGQNRVHEGYGQGAALKVFADWMDKIDPLNDPD